MAIVMVSASPQDFSCHCFETGTLFNPLRNNSMTITQFSQHNFAHVGSDNTGLYSLVIGAAEEPDAPVPAGMVRVVVPASTRAVWQTIWQRTDLAKTFIAQ